VKFYVETYGCWLAKADSRILEHRLTSMGHTLVDSVEEADVIIVNTCAVREDSESRELKRIKELALTGKRILVVGCLAKARPYTIRSIAPNVAVADANAPDRISLDKDLQFYKERSTSMLPRYNPARHGVIHVVPIQVGCLCNCTFCITKYTRGGAGYVRSYPPDSIVENIRDAVSRGAKEIYLTGQDVTTYGFDKGWSGGWNLPSLLRRILEEVPGRYMIRIGMSEPYVAAKFIDEIIELMREDRRLYQFFHLPVQSGSDRVLRLMRRKHTVGEYVELVKKIRRELPRAFIATDIIVGFPGETEEDFEDTLRLVRDLRFDKVHVARYSRRPFTEAAVMPNQVPDKVKKIRSKILSELSLRISYEKNAEYVGSRLEVLIDEVDHGLLVGRAFNYRQVVVDLAERANHRLGEFVEVNITRADSIYLYSEKVAQTVRRSVVGVSSTASACSLALEE